MQREDGSTYQKILHSDDKVRVLSDQQSIVPPPRPGMALKKVTRVFRGETYEWLHLILSTGEELTCTREHPFSVKGKGWVLANDLETGDQFLTADGKECSLAGRWIEKLEHPETTYNFEVEGLHNYFVGENGVLVHNQCPPTVAKEGEFQARVNTGNEHGVPHAHILKGNERVAVVSKTGELIEGSLARGTGDFVKDHLDEIAKGIDDFFPKR